MTFLSHREPEAKATTKMNKMMFHQINIERVFARSLE